MYHESQYKKLTRSRDIESNRLQSKEGMRVMRLADQRLASSMTDIVSRITKRLQYMRHKSLDYILISDVVSELNASQILLTDNAEPINFSKNHNNKRDMQTILNPRNYIPDVLDALHSVFPGCDRVIVKVIRSKSHDRPQVMHYDFNSQLVHLRVPTLSAFHYSVIIAIEPNTHLLIHNKRVNIPINSMICFRGNIPHAGGGYSTANTRLFISLSCAQFPVDDNVYIVSSSKTK
jgi:hypothetical protein